MSLCFCQPLCAKASVPLEEWCRSVVAATDIHSATAELAARVFRCKVLLHLSAYVYTFVCAVRQRRLFPYKLVLTDRDRGCAECDEGARGALSDSWRSKLPRVSSSLTHISCTDQKMILLFFSLTHTPKQANATAKSQHPFIPLTIQTDVKIIKNICSTRQ